MTAKQALPFVYWAIGIEVLLVVVGALVIVWLGTDAGSKLVESGLILLFPTTYLAMGLLAERENT